MLPAEDVRFLAIVKKYFVAFLNLNIICILTFLRLVTPVRIISPLSKKTIAADTGTGLTCHFIQIRVKLCGV